MWELTQICGKWVKYVLKWLNYLTNGLKMWKMTQRFGKWPKYLRNGLDTWDTALVLGSGFTMLEMAEEFDK